ncbi:hypothetical protein SLA2020_099860 [Shorea laevis]
MGSNGQSWADQWGTSSFGSEDDHGKLMNKKASGSSGKKIAEVKAAASVGLDKAKEAAATGAQKVKSGTSLGIKWVKNQYQKKMSSK